MGTVSTFVACCYKHDICILISTIVTWNTLKCAISRAKFQQQKILGRDTALHTYPSCALATSLSPPLSGNPGSTTGQRSTCRGRGHIVAASRIACYSCRNFGVFSGGNCWKTALECLTWYQSDPLQIRIWKKTNLGISHASHTKKVEFQGSPIWGYPVFVLAPFNAERPSSAW